MDLFNYNKKTVKEPEKEFKKGTVIKYSGSYYTVAEVGDVVVKTVTGKFINKRYCEPDDRYI